MRVKCLTIYAGNMKFITTIITVLMTAALIGVIDRGTKDEMIGAIIVYAYHLSITIYILKRK